MKTTTRYEPMFSRLNAAGQAAFVPFWMLGDPGPEESLACIDALIAGGADALELGIPFSDPTADGPIVQEAGLRARAAGTTVEVAFSLIERVRENHPKIPIGLLVYANLVVSPGVDVFYARAAKAGVDSILVADVPSFEMTLFSDAARRASVAPIMIAPPNSDDGLIAEIAAMSDAYVYVVSRAGVTGITDDISWTQADLIAKLGNACAPPALIGFGIRSPADVRAAIAQGAAGAISGSAGISLVASSSDTGDLCGSLQAWCQAMADAAHGG